MLASRVVLMLRRRECSFMCLFMVLMLVVLQPQVHCRFVALGIAARTMDGGGEKTNYKCRGLSWVHSVRLRVSVTRWVAE